MTQSFTHTARFFVDMNCNGNHGISEHLRLGGQVNMVKGVTKEEHIGSTSLSLAG